MAQNRLNLDFNILSRRERVEYAQKYLASIPFIPTSDEIETISNYILWGVDENGLNGRQEGLDLKTKDGLWDKNGRVESLDALIESPGFNEASLRNSIENPPTKIPHQKLSRSQIRNEAPPQSIEVFETLWRQIDETELLLDFYEIKNGKRTEIRETLLKRIGAPVQDSLRARAEALGPYAALKLKHQLVELRREQYALKDSFSPTLLVQPQSAQKQNEFFLEEDVSIFPLGLKKPGHLSDLIWNKDRYPEPNDFQPEDLKALTTLLWKEKTAPPSKRYIDFRDVDQLYVMFQLYDELEDAGLDEKNEQVRALVETLKVYWNLADLDPILERILEMKVKKMTNQKISEEIEQEFGKKYRANYISTLYCKKCLAQIAAAASTHREVLENVFFTENFKKCKDCGRTLLLNEENFVRRHKSNDGFSPRCKKCEKIKRDGRSR